MRLVLGTPDKLFRSDLFFFLKAHIATLGLR